MSDPVIGYHNLLEDSTGTVSVSTEATGFDMENAYDWFLYDWWKPTAAGLSYLYVTFGAAKTADYFAVFGHDLQDHTGQVKLQYSTAGAGGPWSDATSYRTPSSGVVLFDLFASISAADWRMVLNSTGTIASIGMVAFGDRLTLPRGMMPGFKPPMFGNDDVYLNSNSENGSFIGRSLVRHGVTFDIRQELMTPAFTRASYLPFLEHAQTKPFFFQWDDDNYNSEAAFCHSTKKIDAPAYSHSVFMKHTLKVRGLIEI